MFKRIFDIFTSVIILFFFSPGLLLIICILKYNLGSPVFFCQNRPGLNGKIFRMIKFRTMRNVLDQSGKPFPDEQRMTPLGRFLRTTSLDELPELWNVLKGDMSLVGPRPLLAEYLPLYNVEQYRRHEVLPGITGWAQVNGRNSLSWEEKFKLDVWYVDHQSFWLDMKILFLTVKKVLVRDGISASGEVTMHKFTGTESGVGDCKTDL